MVKNMEACSSLRFPRTNMHAGSAGVTDLGIGV